MSTQPQSMNQSSSLGIELRTNKVLRNTYMLLAATVGFAALVAAVSISLRLPYPGIIVTLVGFYGLLFLVHKTKNSSMGILSTFAFTGFTGYTMGPIVAHYLNMPSGSTIVMSALGLTAITFASLSIYALTSRKNFSFMSSFLFAGIIVVIIAMIANFFLQIPMLSLALSAGIAILMAGMILFETSNIIHGGETNYIMATVNIYVSLYNMFLSLMHILGFSQSE